MSKGWSTSEKNARKKETTGTERPGSKRMQKMVIAHSQHFRTCEKLSLRLIDTPYPNAEC